VNLDGCIRKGDVNAAFARLVKRPVGEDIKVHNARML
jgi:hypothetical protein